MITWSKKEWSALIQHGIANYDPGWNKVNKRYYAAQHAVLEPHRVRPHDPAAQSKWNKAVSAGVLKLRKPQPAPTPAPSGTLAAKQPLADNQLKDPLEALVLQLLAKPAVQDAIVAILTSRFAVALPTAAEPTSNVITLRHKDKLPTVLIGGLKGHQITEIANAFKGALDMVFWSSDRSLQELKQKAPNCEHAFGFINFISHSADSIMKARSPHYHQVSGGLDTLKKEMARVVKPTRSLSQTLQTYPYS